MWRRWVLLTALTWALSQATQEEGRTCGSLDIRNSVQQLEMLRGCRVVEGFVHIVLIDGANETAFNNVSFPELLEITCYLLLFRVNGLRSLGALFPNLSVIRGNTLVMNYALVVYEMKDLQEVGLGNLAAILRGAARFEKNYGLCDVRSVDWNLIASGESYIADNAESHSCPGVAACAGCERGLCWGRGRCQRLHFGVCHPLCLGGCSGPGPSDCTVCRGVLVDGECVTRCPPDRYEYMGRRCLTEEECRATTVPPHPPHTESRDGDWEAPSSVRLNTSWPFNGSCVQHCPPGFEETNRDDPRTISCVPCRGHCRRACSGGVVDSIASAQMFRGCSYVTPSLAIQIRDGGLGVNELEDSLSTIEEIEGFLKISRSFSLVSLDFLKRLRVIHGRTLDQGKYALTVTNNDNLKDLWDWKLRLQDFRINNGSLFFHSNPRLCLSKIERLREIAGLPNYTNLEVARESNGDRVPCHIVTLEAHVNIKHPTSVVIEWEPYVTSDPRSLLGYMLYYKETAVQNVTVYDGREACVRKGWKVIDVGVPEGTFENTSSSTNLTQLLTHLLPYTQYAFYVETYSVTNKGGQSPIQYFRTLPGRPSLPVNVHAVCNSSSEVVLYWQPPVHPNGILTHYIISGAWQKDDQKFLDQRDYCAFPLDPMDEKPRQTVTAVVKNETQDCCSKYTISRIDSPEDYEAVCLNQKHHSSAFTSSSTGGLRDACKSYIFTYLYKTVPSLRNDLLDTGGNSGFRNKSDKLSDGRSQNANLILERFPLSDEYPPATRRKGYNPANRTVLSGEGLYERFYHRVEANTSHVVLRNLYHFAEYTIYISACRARHRSNDDGEACSFPSLVTLRTQPCESCDVIRDVAIDTYNKTDGDVYLTWKEPRRPNGIVTTYHIEYRRTGVENFKPVVDCIARKQQEIEGGGYVLRGLIPGNYSFRVRATSLAGEGPFTPMVYFNVEEERVFPPVTIVAVILTFMFLVTVIAGLVYWRKRKEAQQARICLVASVNPDYVSSSYVEDAWEIQRDRLELLKELGQGSFGMVHEAILQPGNIRCAVKMVNETATSRERMEFLNEASVMKSFADAYHVVKLLGVVSRGQPPLVVMELMALGDLKTYLRSSRTPPPPCPDLQRVMMMAAAIADGMAYLEARKFVHRDLAARNCMVAEDLTIKIGDFGMTRDIYETDYYRNGSKGLLPVRWMAPESLGDGLFTIQSDVWSYGVVLWEIVTLAEQPYQGLANEQVLQYVLGGGLLSVPSGCPPTVGRLMELCWNSRPARRPSFLDIIEQLDTATDLGPAFHHFSYYSETKNRLNGLSARESFDNLTSTLPEVAFCRRRNGKDFSVTWAKDLVQPTHSALHEEEAMSQVTDTLLDINPVNKASSSVLNGYICQQRCT